LFIGCCGIEWKPTGINEDIENIEDEVIGLSRLMGNVSLDSTRKTPKKKISDGFSSLKITPTQVIKIKVIQSKANENVLAESEMSLKENDKIDSNQIHSTSFVTLFY